MPGNSSRRNRRSTPKRGAAAGTGGKNRQSLVGRGRTLPADERPWHKGYSGDEQLPERTAWKQEKERRTAAAEGRAPKVGLPGTKRTTNLGGKATSGGKATADRKVTADGKPGGGGAPAGRKSGGGGAPTGGSGAAGGGRGGGSGAAGRGRTGGSGPTGGGRGTAGGRGGAKVGPRVAPGRRSAPPRDAPELLVGRNPVVEALRAHAPATALYVAQGVVIDERVKEAVQAAGDRGIAILEITRVELDRMTGGVLHQGLGLQVPPYAYEPFEDLLAAAAEQVAPLLVALDGVTDPRNLGAVVRSAAAFGARGVFLPERRSASMTATAWRTSAGAAARLPVARVTNLTRALTACQEQGFIVVGLDADGELSIYDLEVAIGPLVVVVGSEGRGLSRLVGETCDLLAAIPMASEVESLNASVAASVTLAEVARRRG